MPHSQFSPFEPRRRVHKAENMLELIDILDAIAKVRIPMLRNELAEIRFDNNLGKRCIVQDGLSDWDFLGLALDQCRVLRPKADWLRCSRTQQSMNNRA